MTKRNNKKDFKDRLAALAIYLELSESTNSNTFVSSTEMTKRLEDKYGKENAPSHNTVAKYLKALMDYSEDLSIDVRRGNSRQGYCLADREFSEWEIRLFVEAILNSKSLSNIDKKNIIDKCYMHLGKDSSEELNDIYYYLFDSKTKKKKSVDIEETLEAITEAINKNNKIIIGTRISNKPITQKYSYPRKISPYRIFTYDNILYLIYGTNSIVSDKTLLQFDELERIEYIKTLNEKSYPITSIVGYENGIDEKRLRKDPFGYLTKSDDEMIIAEIILEDELAINNSKSEIEKEFGYSVSFCKDKNKNYVYIQDDYEKCLNWFLFHSREYKVTAPKFMVKLLKYYTRNMFITYADEDMNLKEYPNEFYPIKYITKQNKRYYVKR